MFGRVFAAATLVAGVALALAPAAAAADDDPYGWNTYHDRTDTFVAPLDPGAFTDKADRALVLSPLGTAGIIECKGDGHYVRTTCRQTGPGGVRYDLVRVIDAPLRPLWVVNPFGSTGS